MAFEGQPTGAERRGPGCRWAALAVGVLSLCAPIRAQSAYVLLEAGADPSAVAKQLQGSSLRMRALLAPAQRSRLESRLAAAGADAKSSSALERLGRWQRLEGDARELAALALDPGRHGIERFEAANLHWIAAQPNDPLLDEQPYIPLIRATEAYDKVRGEDRVVVVAIVDAGTDWRHEDLLANIHEFEQEIEGNGIDDDGNGFVDDRRGWNFADDSNDPTGLPQTPDNARHGTHIAGIVAAVSDNELGVAGVSWNARILPVNVGSATTDQAVPYGFEGLLYAVSSGADVVNLSWGRRNGRWSDFEHDAVLVAEAAGVLVIAAAGNGIVRSPFYPAYYPSVLSVTRVGLDLRHHFSANHDFWIDLAAPGSRILSTWPGNTYGRMDGTSQACAVASGAAALLRASSGEPVTPAELRARLRWTATKIDALNPGLERELGCGLVDAAAALGPATPGIEIANLRLRRADDAGQPGRGELLGLYFDLVNHLDSSGAFTLQLFNRHGNLTALRSSQQIGGILAGQLLSVKPGLLLWADDNTPAGETGGLTIEISTANGTVHQDFTVEPVAGHVAVDAGALHLTHTDNGRLGYLQPLRARDPGGVGIGTPNISTLVQFGSLVVGLDATRVADAMIAPADASLYRDFRPPFSGGIQELEDGASSIYTDALAVPRVGVRVEQRTHRVASAQDFLLVAYDLTPTAGPWQGARAGLLVDFELGRFGSGERDRIEWLAEDALMLARSENWESPQLGVALVEGPAEAGFSWLRDLRTDDPDGRPYLFDAADLDFRTTNAQLWYLLGRHDGPAPSESGSVAGVLHCGPFDVAAAASARLVVAWVVGADRTAVRAAAARARLAWSYLRAGEQPPQTPRLELMANVPNPFNPLTRIRFTLDRAQPVELRVFDARGRRVRNLLNARLEPGYHELAWDGLDDGGDALSSGVYHVLLSAGADSARRSVVLLR